MLTIGSGKIVGTSVLLNIFYSPNNPLLACVQEVLPYWQSRACWFLWLCRPAQSICRHAIRSGHGVKNTLYRNFFGEHGADAFNCKIVVQVSMYVGINRAIV